MKFTTPQFRIENASNVILDAVKKAENSNDVIVRMYEAYGGHARARLIRYC
jgi:alpha-mannosidase